MAATLAIQGGAKIREGKKFPAWPIYGNGEADALIRTLNSGVWGIGGTETERFEKTFAEYQHCKYAVTMVNGSLTLRNALLACGIPEGSEVIVPPYTFLATATSVIEANCVPVFADVDPDTYCIDPKAIEKAISPRTKAIIPVHLGGHAAPMDEIMAIAKRNNLFVIEDCAHAHGSEYKGRRVGSVGDIGSFSFQSSKNLCCGEGGSIVSNNSTLAEMCWSIQNCGRTRSGAWYHHANLGSNYRLSQFQAAVLNEQIKKLDHETDLRERNAAYLNEKLSAIPGIRPLARKEYATRNAYHLYLFRFDSATFDGVPRSLFLDAMKAEGIPAAEGYSTLVYQQPFMQKKEFATFNEWKHTNKELDYSKTVCPVAEKAASIEGCWMHHSVLLGTREDMNDIVNAVSKIYENRKQLLAK